MDLDEETAERIRAHVERQRVLEARMPPDPPKEAVMSIETVMKQRVKIATILGRMEGRRTTYREGPRGE